MHFLLSNMSVVYVLTTPILEDGENTTMEKIRKRNTWDNDDYVCRGLILNDMSNPLFDIYQNIESSKELWDSLKAKYMAEYASSKKFLVSNFINYKMTYSRPVMEQYNELIGILRRFTQHKMNMDEAIQVSCIIDKLPPSWKYFKHTLKHQKEELTLVELGSHMRIEKSLIVQDNDKPKGNNVDGTSVVNMMKHNNSFRYNDNKGKCKHQETKDDPNKKSKVTYWKCEKLEHLKKDYKGEKVGNKANGSGTNGLVDVSTNSLKGQNMFNKSLQVYYVTYGSEAYFVKDDDVVWLNIVNDNIGSAFTSTSKLNDSISWHARLVHAHFKRMQDMSKDGLISVLWTLKSSIGIIHETTAPITPQQNSIFEKKNKVLEEMDNSMVSYSRLKHYEAFRFYIIEPNESILINSIIESRDVIFDENRLTSVLRLSLRIPNGTEDIGGSVVPEEVTEEVVTQQLKPEYHKTTDCYGINSQSDYSSDVYEDNFLECEYIYDSSEKLMPNNGQAVSQLKYSRVIGCLMYVMTCTRPDIAFAVGELSSCCVATLAKAYSLMYNGKSRHLGVRHSMIHELIMNGVVSIEFVRSQQNLVDHLTKGLTRDLVFKSAERMDLQSNQVVEC
ncbi:zinc finger, CCHC-type containing protein [Tanacetum coccineum]